MVIKPLDKDQFIERLKVSEQYGSFSESAVESFYDWMYSDKDGYVQVCAFLIPTQDDSELPEGHDAYEHTTTKQEFVDFCMEHSDLWRYQVYAGVNTLSEEPKYGRGGKDYIGTVNTFTLDIETDREPHTGASRQAVWWSYQYALAQVKYINEVFDVWPMVVMSENGIHLHYNADLPVKDKHLHNRQHRVTKYITKLAMNNDYVNKIQQQAPERIDFSPDDVSDVARVMKVPGTLGIKSEANRLCGIIHKPSKEARGCITLEDVEQYYIPEFTNGSSNANSSSANVTSVSISPTTGELNEQLKKRLKEHCIEDNMFKAFFSGKTLNYDSRSDAEFAFILKLLNYSYTKDEVPQVMSASGMEKWNEESKHYKEKTLSRALAEFDGNTKADRHTGSVSFRSVGE